MSTVPAAEKTLDVLLTLARAAGPISAATISRECAIPKSSLYHLLATMQSRGFVAPAGNATWGLGASAFEAGAAYIRHESTEQRARPILKQAMVATTKIRSVVSPVVGPVVGHVGILRGNDTLYILKESTSRQIALVTDVGVRLPAHLTASGRAMLAHLSVAQVRALFPDARAFADRTGAGPQTLSELRTLLRAERERGFAREDGFITPGYSSVAAAVFDHLGQPTASMSVTFRQDTVDLPGCEYLVEIVQDSAQKLTDRIGGHHP
ncbi:MAG: IclR family transcriptional regulator [Candidatus Nanopelagicales bacterium]|nr:IclR family transcriptional regulator [Candidatus Nanopelagicales bacterium]